MNKFRWPGAPGVDAAGHRWITPMHVITRHGRRIKVRGKTMPAVATFTCRRCGKVFDANVAHGGAPKFCSLACSARAASPLGVAARAAARPAHTTGGPKVYRTAPAICEHCGGSYARRLDKAAQRCCSVACHQARRRAEAAVRTAALPAKRPARRPMPLPEEGARHEFWTVQRQRTADRVMIRCACGFERWITAARWRGSKSCGCGGRTFDQVNRPASFRAAWRLMVRRCHDPADKDFRWYGARGVTVCDRWREDWRAFVADMSPRPSAGHTLDRIDPARGYDPANCWWVRAHEQNRADRF